MKYEKGELVRGGRGRGSGGSLGHEVSPWAFGTGFWMDNLEKILPFYIHSQFCIMLFSTFKCAQNSQRYSIVLWANKTIWRVELVEFKKKKESGDSFIRLEDFLLFKNAKTRNSEVDKLAGDYLNNKRNLFQKLSFKDSLNSKHLVFTHLKCDLFVGVW